MDILSSDIILGSAAGAVVSFWAIVFVCELAQQIWAGIDDQHSGHNKVLSFLHSKFDSDTRYEAFNLFIGYSVIAFLVPLVGFLCIKFYAISLCIGLAVGLFYLARFSRRLFKRFNKHEENKNIHQKR